MKLYIVRHGETDWNKARRVQGFSDIPLNEYGRHLARETAEGMKDIPFDLAYTSPLIRARETAEIILAGREIPLIESNGIKEMGFGEYEGMCISGKEKAPESEAFKKFFIDTGNFVPAKGGESISDIMDFWKWQVPANCAVTTVDVSDGVLVIAEESKVYYKDPVKRWSVE